LVLTAGVAACFVSHGRSFLIRGYSCPLKPQQGIRFAHSFFKRGQPPLVVVLACGSLGLIGLSRFLHCSVPFFCPAFFSGLCRVSFRSFRKLHSHRKTFFYPKQECRLSVVHSFIPQATFFHSFKSAHLPCPQKNSTAQQKTHQPCVFHVGSRSPPDFDTFSTVNL
jgi:hypothetical protein